MTLNRYACILTGLALLNGCSLPQQAAPPIRSPEQPVPPPSLQDTQITRAYTLDASTSELRILVYRGGPMARLGHNHVISAATLHGRIWLAPTVGASGFDIRVPVEALVVDDNAARLAEGADFPLNLSDEAKQSTKANMLRETLLDSARFPEVRIQSVRIEGSSSSPQVVAALRIRDQSRELRMPVQFETTATGLRVRGQFSIRQSDFGMTPLSLAMGALRVENEVQIRFDLRATPA